MHQLDPHLKIGARILVYKLFTDGKNANCLSLKTQYTLFAMLRI